MSRLDKAAGAFRRGFGGQGVGNVYSVTGVRFSSRQDRALKIKSHQVSFVPGSNLQLLVEISREDRRILRIDLALLLALLVGGAVGAVIVAGLLDPANCLPWAPLNRWAHWIGIC